ncbi:MAG: hypothetical protein ACRD25_06995 [Terracidiphilus sp.]
MPAEDLTPAVDTHSHAPARAEPPKTAFPTPEAKVQPSAGAVQAAPRPIHTFVVQTSPQTASAPPMSSAAPPPRHPAPPEPDSILERDKTLDRLLRAIREAGPLEGEIPASNPEFTHLVRTSPGATSASLMPPATAPPHRRVSATPRTMEAASWAAVPQVPSPPPPPAVAEPAPTAITPRRVMPARDGSPRTTILVRCSSEISRLGVKLALTTKSMGRATTRISIQFKNWMETKAAPAMPRLGRSVWLPSIRLWSWAKTRAALTMKSMDISGAQHSTGLDDRAHATQSAPAMESMGQARPQSPMRLQRWFDPRRSSRLAKPPVVAYCWTADTPHPVKIADISSGGVHLLTDARWPRGGVLPMTLQRTDRASQAPESWIVINFMVIRLCDDGVAGAFIPSTHRLARFIASRAENCADDRALKRFVRHLAVPAGA